MPQQVHEFSGDAQVVLDLLSSNRLMTSTILGAVNQCIAEGRITYEDLATPIGGATATRLKGLNVGEETLGERTTFDQLIVRSSMAAAAALSASSVEREMLQHQFAVFAGRLGSLRPHQAAHESGVDPQQHMHGPRTV